jgi:hypothetical protein
VAAKLTIGQRHVLDRIKAIGDEVGATPKERKAAIETGLVESNLRNLPGGDADSAGWRQERASLYRNPTNLDASIRRFYRETRAVGGQYGRAGDLAAAVQRPAAQFRGRYQGVSGQAQALLGGGGIAPQSARQITRTVTPGVDNSALRGQLVQQFLGQKGGDVLDFALGIRGAQDVAPVTRTQTVNSPTAVAGGGGASRYAANASAIDAQRLPYKWGGGHGGRVTPGKAQPLDCSGAVSAVLGINPRVSGDFNKIGKPGAGDGKGVVIYSNNKHVLMSIGGRFWGTSASNPGGGAGWIPRSQISPAYLSQFTVRHLPGS